MPGLGIYLIEKYQLDRKQLIMVGDRQPDREFAEGLGIQYYDEAEFFSEATPVLPPPNTPIPSTT